jgi:ABC-type multidrug transport system ATPase subunit
MAGRTTLIIAHRLSTISLADRVLLMDEGRIVADGTHAELMETVPLYADVLAQGEDYEPDLPPAGGGGGEPPEGAARGPVGGGSNGGRPFPGRHGGGVG